MNIYKSNLQIQEFRRKKITIKKKVGEKNYFKKSIAFRRKVISFTNFM